MVAPTMPSAQPGRPAAPPKVEPEVATCPLCGVATRPAVRGVVAPETGAAFGVDRCPRCGLGRTVPTPDDLAPYYGPAYYGNRHGVTAALCRRRRLRLVRRWAGRGEGRALLDYGCGDGDFAAAARPDGWSAAGVERQPPREAPAGVPIAADLDDLGGIGPFGCATFWHVLEHLDDPVATLGRVRGRLAPDGVVVAAVPNFASWQARATGPAWLPLDLPRHLWHFTPEALARTFVAAGYRVEGLAFGEWEYDVVGWSQSVLTRVAGGDRGFFRAMSGRPGVDPIPRRAFDLAAGLGLSLGAAVPAWLEARLGRGGTLIMAARPASGGD